MLEKIIHFSIQNKLIVILFTLTIAAFGVYSVLHIPVGAVPDITNNQVQVITTSGNLSTQEIEQFITAPIELEMANLPGVKEMRSISKFGLSVVTIVFSENMGTYLPRQLIAEKIKSASANIPPEFGSPEMGPITTGLGEIYQYTLDVKPGYESRYSVMDLRTIQDWTVRRQLSGINGVVEVNSWGGYLKQYEIAVDPQKLSALHLSLMDVYNALEANSSISGGGYIEKRNESYFIRGDGQVASLADIEQIVVRSSGSLSVLVRDVATVQYGYANRYGAITANGDGEKVLGQVMMLKNANSKVVIEEVKKRVDEIQNHLPEGVYINPILERSELISKTSMTVLENLLLGCLIVLLMVIVLLGNIRSALVIASMIPLSLLFTLSMMYIFGIDANLMSLGALDFGIIIDGAVIIVEYIAVRMTQNRSQLSLIRGTEQQTLLDSISQQGATNMMHSAIFGQVIILIVFIPILSLSGVEGKMFRPMALAFSFAIIGAMFFCLTWLPVAASLFLKPQKSEKKNLSDKIMGLLQRTYQPVMRWAYDQKVLVIGLAAGSLVATLLLFSQMGGEFVPTLDEGDFVIQPVLKTGTSLTRTIELTTQMEKILKRDFPEVDKVVCRIGAAEVPTDPMSMEEIDMIIKLKPRKQWVSARSKEELANKFKEALSVIPGIEYEFTQPIEMRFNELITGVRADIAVKIFGEDLDYLSKKAIEVKKLIEKVPGAADVILEKTTGLPQYNVKYNRTKIAQYGIDIKSLNRFVSAAFGGEKAGVVFEGEKRFDMVLRLDASSRTDIENIRQLQYPLPSGAFIPLQEVADVHLTQGPAKISRENAHRRIVISVNVRDRDLQSVVRDIQATVAENVRFETGNYVVYGGQFENLQNASKRLMIAVPIALLLIFIMLHFAFKSMRDAAMIFIAVPLAVVGGVFALWIRGMPFSISAGIGFIALFGIAVLNGIVLIEHLKHLKESLKDELDMKSLVLKGASERLRPVALTASAAAMGFLPMAISSSAGAEVQRPLATVVIGGLITSTMLTMILLPILFSLFNQPVSPWIKKISMKLQPQKKALSVILLLVMANTLTLHAQNAPVLTLEKAVEQALQRNIDVKIQQLNVDEQQALSRHSLPFEKTKLYYGYDQSNMAENGHPLQTIGLEQTFLFPTAYAAERKIAYIHLTMSEVEKQKRALQLAKAVSQTYLALQVQELKLKEINQLDTLYSALLTKTEKKLAYGDISRLDLLNLHAKQQQIATEKKQLALDIAHLKQQLKQQIVSEDANFEIETSEPTILIPITPQKQTPDWELLALNTDFLNADLRLKRQQIFPNIIFNYFYGSNRYEPTRGYHGFQVGLGIPLLPTAERGQIKAGKIAVQRNELFRQQAEIKWEQRIRQLQTDLDKQKLTIETYLQSGKKLSNELLNTATISYQKGEIPFTQWVMSVENSKRITIDYLQAVKEHNQIVLEINYITLDNL